LHGSRWQVLRYRLNWHAQWLSTEMKLPTQRFESVLLTTDSVKS
jgi:hypothetical protein